jgi:hypothetical protein
MQAIRLQGTVVHRTSAASHFSTCSTCITIQHKWTMYTMLKTLRLQVSHVSLHSKPFRAIFRQTPWTRLSPPPNIDLQLPKNVFKRNLRQTLLARLPWLLLRTGEGAWSHRILLCFRTKPTSLLLDSESGKETWGRYREVQAH